MKNKIRNLIYPNHIENMLPLVEELQTKYPSTIIGGSIGLYLHGVKLKRFKNYKGDIDLISFKKIKIELEESKELSSGCDFQDQGKRNGIKVDVCYDMSAKFDSILFKGVIYHVNPLHVILHHKCKYDRHKDTIDLREMLKLKKK